MTSIINRYIKNRLTNRKSKVARALATPIPQQQFPSVDLNTITLFRSTLDSCNRQLDGAICDLNTTVERLRTTYGKYTEVSTGMKPDTGGKTGAQVLKLHKG